MDILLLLMVLGLIPALIASHKGRSGFVWWIYGMLLFIIALPHALLLSPLPQRSPREPGPATDRVPCPQCAEFIRLTARLCPFCRQDVSAAMEARQVARQTQARVDAERADDRSIGYSVLTIGLLLVLALLLLWPSR